VIDPSKTFLIGKIYLTPEPTDGTMLAISGILIPQNIFSLGIALILSPCGFRRFLSEISDSALRINNLISTAKLDG
jgi:hypothetical protein